MNTSILRALLLASVALPAGAFASPIVMTESATATGSLNGVAYANALVTMTSLTDTLNTVDEGGGLFTNVAPATVSVAGIGTFALNDPVISFSSQGDLWAGFADGVFYEVILGTFNPAFATYDLTSPTGPLSGDPVLNGQLAFGTSGGDLKIESSGPVTFSAQAVPEPTSLAALGLGVAAVLRRRNRTE